MASQNPIPGEELFHIELGPATAETVVFLHGLLSCHLESANATPHLGDYHLLLVDLNGHSASSAIRPYTIQSMADNVATLIRRYAHNGAAHVVGVSMGGYTALELARRHPHLVRSVFNAGAVPPNRKSWFLRRPGIVWLLMEVALNWLPEWLYRWLNARQGLVIPDELTAALRRNVRREVVCGVCLSMLEFGWEELAQVKPRTLGVAAGLSRGEDPEAMKRAGKVLRENGSEESRAVVLRQAVHAWILQKPELLARGVRAWVEGEELPGEYETL